MKKKTNKVDDKARQGELRSKRGSPGGEGALGQKILIAMSGGVDSSVVAALLVELGYDVTGVFMKQWTDTNEFSGVCSWKEDRRDALRVAAHLGIPMITLDFESEYKKWVMEYMFSEYEKGRTPNPDVLCNKFIKFGVWLEKAKELGFDKLATGHYARLQREETRNKKQETNKFEYHLMEAKDKNKDQTYFLHQLTQEQLRHVLFPLGEYKKEKVRKLATKFGLPTADKEESMGICFVGEVPMKEFLLQKIKLNKGKIVTTSGVVVGEHDGLPFYTIGQRHGFDLSLREDSKEDSKPLYIIDKNFDKNELVVGYEKDPLFYKKEIKVIDISWVSGQKPQFPLKCEVRLRHRQIMQKAKLNMINDELLVEFDEPQKAITPGQFAVFYSEEECLGGSIIK